MFRRKRPVILQNCSVSIENLSSYEGARAIHAKNDARKGCAVQLKGNHLKRKTDCGCSLHAGTNILKVFV